MKVASVSEMRAMDRHAIEHLGIPEEILMENAGQASSRILERRVGMVGKKIAVLCGAGNNGGDGFVVARTIHANGGVPLVFTVGNMDRLGGAAGLNRDMLHRIAVPLTAVTSASAVRKDILHCDGIVDAVFGTGLDRPVAGIHRDLIELVNESGKPVLSLDIPSGINGDTGEIMGCAVRADWTVTFGLPKRGNLLYPGYEFGGELAVTHISFPPALHDRDAIEVETNDHVALPPRRRTAHKGQLGDVLFIAGAADYFGAPFFAAFSHLKAGGGYTRLAAPRAVIPVVAAQGKEIVFHPLEETDTGSIAPANRERLLALADRVDMVVLGPGLSLHEATQELVRELAAALAKPLLIDGDGLTALAGFPEIVRGRTAGTILTPHLGEMARLTKKSTADIEGDKIPLLQETARSWNAVVVMKGAHTLIGTPRGRVFINMSGNAGMATAGSGDVLTGAITAMAGLGLPLVEAVRKGVFLHGRAGDLAAVEKGEDGMTARDILDHLPAAVQEDRRGRPEGYDIRRVI